MLTRRQSSCLTVALELVRVQTAAGPSGAMLWYSVESRCWPRDGALNRDYIPAVRWPSPFVPLLLPGRNSAVVRFRTSCDDTPRPHGGQRVSRVGVSIRWGAIRPLSAVKAGYHFAAPRDNHPLSAYPEWFSLDAEASTRRTTSGRISTCGHDTPQGAPTALRRRGGSSCLRAGASAVCRRWCASRRWASPQD